MGLCAENILVDDGRELIDEKQMRFFGRLFSFKARLDHVQSVLLKAFLIIPVEELCKKTKLESIQFADSSETCFSPFSVVRVVWLMLNKLIGSFIKVVIGCSAVSDVEQCRERLWGVFQKETTVCLRI